MYKNKFISLVLPCRNEANAIKNLLEKVPSFIDEVVVVDNNSKDNTVAVARKLGAKVYRENRTDNGIGYGFALARGINSAKGDLVICMDGDGSYPLKITRRIVDYLLKNDLDFISCNRLPVLESKKMSSFRMLGVNVLNWMIRILYGVKIKDSLTGMWVFRKSALAGVFLIEGGWNFSLEIKLAVFTNRYLKFEEYHIPYKDRVFDQSKQNLIMTGTTHLWYLIAYRLFKNISLITKSRISLVNF